MTLFKLFRSVKFSNNSINIRIYTSYDILTSPPLQWYNFLLNSANEALIGTRQPYFPVGGPVPPIPEDGRVISSSRWGGMEAGENMMYGVQVLDGMVHDECGPDLLKYLQNLPVKPPLKDAVGQEIRCPVGNAVVSPAFGGLSSYFGGIIHTVPPFYLDQDWEDKLRNCYLQSFRLAWLEPHNKAVSSSSIMDSNSEIAIAAVLLGSGCRGIPVHDAARLAASACSLFHDNFDALDRSIRGDLNTSTVNILNHAGDGRAASASYLDSSKDWTSISRRIDFILRDEDHCRLLTEHLLNNGARLQKE